MTKKGQLGILAVDLDVEQDNNFLCFSLQIPAERSVDDIFADVTKVLDAI